MSPDTAKAPTAAGELSRLQTENAELLVGLQQAYETAIHLRETLAERDAIIASKNAELGRLSAEVARVRAQSALVLTHGNGGGADETGLDHPRGEQRTFELEARLATERAEKVALRAEAEHAQASAEAARDIIVQLRIQLAHETTSSQT